MTNQIETKTCIKCGNKYQLDKFPYHNKSINTRRNECRFCYNSRKKKEYHRRKSTKNSA